MLNHVIWILWAAAAIIFLVLIALLITTLLTDRLPELFYMEVRTLSGSYRSVTLPEVLGALFILGLLVAAAALILTHYYPSPR
jgi:hypothetical protein